MLTNVECTCKIQWYTILMLSLSLLGLMVFVILYTWKLKLCRGHLFSNAVTVMLFISDEQYYVPVKLCRTAGGIHLFKITGTLFPENVKLKWNLIRDIIELDWKGLNVTLNGNKINLPKSIMVKFWDKFKIWCMVERKPLLFHIMLKQGFTWFTLTSNNPPETVQVNSGILPEIACDMSPQFNFLYWFFEWHLPEDTIDVDITVTTMKGIHTFRKDHATQSSTYSLWCSQIRPFPSLLRKMEACMEEKRNTTNPFSSTRRYLNSPSTSPFSKKTTTTKWSRTDCGGCSKKHHKLRKVEQCFIPTKGVMATFSFLAAIVAMTPKMTTTATGIFVQSPAAQPQPKFNKTQSCTTTSAPHFCHICTPSGRKCPNNYTSPNHPEWSDSTPKEEDWNGDSQKENEQKRKESAEKEKELEQRPITPYYPPSWQYMPSYKSVPFFPELTDTLVQSPLQQEEECLEKQDTEEERWEEEKRRREEQDKEDNDSNLE